MNKRCKLGLERIIGILLSEWLFQKELLGNFLPIVINRIDVGWPEEIRREAANFENEVAEQQEVSRWRGDTEVKELVPDKVSTRGSGSLKSQRSRFEGRDGSSEARKKRGFIN